MGCSYKEDYITKQNDGYYKKGCFSVFARAIMGQS